MSESEFDDLLQQIKTCTQCSLSQTRSNAVPGEGSSSADIMFVGEGPGQNEDRDGRPFVGAAGQFLDQLLASIGLNRADVYITNMVKCRPPGNRDPQPDEMQACRPHLDKQLEFIAPKVLVALGRHAFSKFFPGEPISKARGKPRKWRNLQVFPMYHPAAALHNPGLRGDIEGDFASLPALIERVTRATDEKKKEEKATQASQLSLFE